MPLQIIQDNIVRLPVDAIVNAANSSLLGGGGVDGCIHMAAGPGLLKECSKLHGCNTGDAKITGAYQLPCRYVIHTVGPIWRDGQHGEKVLLESCYRKSLQLAAEHDCKTVAFPLISAGVYGYPKEQAVQVAADTILEFLAEHPMTVYLVIFRHEDLQLPRDTYGSISVYLKEHCQPASSVQESPCGAFAPLIREKLALSGLTAAQFCHRANISSQLLEELLREDAQPGKAAVISCAIGLHLPLDETRELLRQAGFALSPASHADLIVQYFMERGCYSFCRINEALFAFFQTPLNP